MDLLVLFYVKPIFVDNVFITFFPLRRCCFCWFFVSYLIVNGIYSALVISLVIVLKNLVDIYCRDIDL